MALSPDNQRRHERWQANMDLAFGAQASAERERLRRYTEKLEDVEVDDDGKSLILKLKEPMPEAERRELSEALQRGAARFVGMRMVQTGGFGKTR